ncbi:MULTISPECIES: SDR family NAD(P)-dependent oxidoreductase [unclassified Leifsonia]|uniref:SDR family NAD(P)-dependent oxidoreductase n=1 Tax=unclassified Leifsonia TaxID=2663824 RepID=UPI0006FCB0E5|nr:MULTISPECIES: SDR family oxidoreductase [unclassified Leifsonia]KQX06827.1 3-oxoacyl-ACP reductase [Leifsonia sp. Root1293]KRA11112.1 3-oxoacyl-ACP reductase [Leifsonia sp. Root60]
MDLGLTGRTAVVTGASKGIGLAVVRAFVAEGVHVIAGARSSSSALDELVAAGTVEVVALDLSDPDGPGRLIASTDTRIDILVNNVGLATARTNGFLSVTDEQWVTSLNLNLLAAVRACRAVLPGMIGAGGGAIVNVASVNAYLPDPAVIDYSVAKAGLANFAKSLSKEVGPAGVRVNSVNPGPVETALWLGDGGIASTVSGATGLSREEVQSGAVAEAATRRFTTPEEVADLVVFLASDRAANITGAGFAIDGGLVQSL